MTRRGALLIIVLALLAAPAAAEPPIEPTGPNWSLSVDNEHPFLGDPVVITVESVYVGEYAVVDVFKDGERVKSLLVRTNSTKGTETIWQTRLDMQPGAYRISVVHYGEAVANITVYLVYDPVDYALKSLLAHEREMEELRERDRYAEAWATLALQQNRYERRWLLFGAVVNALAMLVLVYLGPEAWFKYVGKRARTEKEWEEYKRHPDGVLKYAMGKETMETTPLPREPLAGVSAWCEECGRLVHVTEWKQHPHVLEYHPEDQFEIKSVRVRPQRVVKVAEGGGN